MQLRKISIAPNVALESLCFSNVRLSTVEIAELNQQQQQQWRRPERSLYKRAIRSLYISHNTPCLPPKFCINFVFYFFWVLKPSQEKTMLMQNFGGQIRCILGDVHVAKRLRLATQQLCTCTMLFWKFLCPLCTTTTWKCLIKISCLLEDVNKWHQFSFSLPVLWYSSLGFINFLPEKFAKNLTKWMTWNNGEEVCNTVNSSFCCRFNIDDGDGSENVTFKIEFTFFKLCRVYSNSLKKSNLSEFPYSWFLGDRTQVWKEIEK